MGIIGSGVLEAGKENAAYLSYPCELEAGKENAAYFSYPSDIEARAPVLFVKN